MNAARPGWQRRATLFLLSQCVTLFGSTLVQMAVIWYATLQTASGAWVAAFTVCAYLPQFLISFVGGVWADRCDRKRLIVGADAAIALVTLAMMLAMPYIREQAALLWALLLMSALRSVGAGIQTPAVNAAIAQMVPQEQLMRYNGFNATMQSAVQFAAPAAAGALLSAGTLGSTLLVDVLTAAVGIGILSFVAVGRREPPKEKARLLEDMRLGVRYAFSDRLIGRLLAVYALFIFLSVPAGFLAQLLVSRVYGDTYWYLTAMELTGFAGMSAGGLLMGAWGGFKSRTKTLAVGLFAFGALAVGMGLSRNFILYLALMALYGVALTMVQTAATTLIQERADENVQGRVFGLMGSVYAGLLPVGMAIFGPLADVLPLQWIMIGSGLALALVAAALRADPHFRDAPKELRPTASQPPR